MLHNGRIGRAGREDCGQTWEPEPTGTSIGAMVREALHLEPQKDALRGAKRFGPLASNEYPLLGERTRNSPTVPGLPNILVVSIF